MKKNDENAKVAPKLALDFIAFVMKIWCFSQRTKIVDDYGIVERGATEPFIFVTWHNRILLQLILLPHKLRRRLCFLASQSKDGGYISEILERFEMIPVRGSTGKNGMDKGGARALVKIRRKLKEKYCVGITPDGPRGPRYDVQNGALWLASKTQVPIVPTAYNAKWHVELNNWDKTHLPIPFSSGDCVFGKPIAIPPQLSEEDFAKYAKVVHSALMKVSYGDHE